MGGTFDYIHKGHWILITRAFDSAENILIGITTDNFAACLGKKIQHNFKIRVENMTNYLNKFFKDRNFKIVPLDNFFGIETYEDNVEAIVASPETSTRVIEFNKERIKLGFKPLKLLVVNTVLAEDGKPISSSRIRLEEINEEGYLCNN